MSKTAIIDAVRRLDLDATRRLLDSNPSLLEVVNKGGWNLLHISCAASCSKLVVPEELQVQLVDSLLDRGFDIDLPVGRDECTPLFFAVARARNILLVKLLIDRGAKPSAAPGGGLFAAGWWEDLDILELLIQSGAEIDVVFGVTPFLACWCWKRFEAVKCLALNGADVNYQDEKGRTALYHGVEKDFDPSLLKWLVDHGASPDVPDNQGVSARMKALRKRDKRFASAFD